MQRIAIWFALLLVSAPSLAEGFKMPVEVLATANDSVGKRLVYFVKEGIQSSATLEPVLNPSIGIRLLIVTIDQNTNNPGYSTAYSFVVTWVSNEQPFPYYLNQYVGYCGSSRVQECAQELVASTAENSEQVLRLLKAAYESSNKK